MPQIENKTLLLTKLNDALAWELRALVMYAHFGAYVKGIHRLHLRPHFEGEAAESLDHARMVRDAIVKLGGEATTERADAPIAHTSDYHEMLDEALQTEKKAAEGYLAILELLDDDHELFDVLQQIYYAEERSMKELEQLIF